MYNVRWLASIARQGFADMLPAAQQAFNDDPRDDRLPLVYGRRGLPWPRAASSSPEAASSAQAGGAMRTRLILLAVAGVALGSVVSALAPDNALVDAVDWPAVLLGAVHALIFRRYLFRSGQARSTDFPWLAASLAPSLCVVMLASFVGWLLVATRDAGPIGVFAHVLVSLTHAVGVAAAMIIALAALCYSRDWLRAVVQLCVRLLVFRIMVWVTTLILLEIGIVGPVLAALMRGVFGFSLPDWVSDLSDAISYAVVMNVIYLAVIGATWTVCRQRFDALLRTGDVDVLQEVAQLAKAPPRRKQDPAEPGDSGKA